MPMPAYSEYSKTQIADPVAKINTSIKNHASIMFATKCSISKYEDPGEKSEKNCVYLSTN